MKNTDFRENSRNWPISKKGLKKGPYKAL